MKKYDTIIFDLDGTLLNTLDDLMDGVNYILNYYHYPERTLEEVRCFVGNGLRRLLALALPDGEENPLFEEAFERFRAYYTEHCQIKTSAYDGILPLLDFLKESGYALAIVSNKNHAAVNALSELYFASQISIAIGEQPTVNRKPAPDTVFAALDALHMKKDNTLYVGDSEVDKLTADNAGIDCALVSWGFRSRKALEALHPTVLIDRPEELRIFLEH
ncbi:HAD family hydrolase [Hespellia stercorisuis]|uniref:Phosphoglycolate phosphatase n=1 Tax=Hespellia stercorisuis DSM 15480 TaxID=1121950 RepID=A0A1M6Q2Q4_9FIRM|nr:HAD family hydrolase [Hespellia stercorisuis]SHK14509.1 phosphoglycolate phosphatase [Hespellia stercorisuis DSM 15480]